MGCVDWEVEGEGEVEAGKGTEEWGRLTDDD